MTHGTHYHAGLCPRNTIIIGGRVYLLVGTASAVLRVVRIDVARPCRQRCRSGARHAGRHNAAAVSGGFGVGTSRV